MFTRQSVAMFVDAYRELNARKLFWITLGLSGLVVAAFAAVGLNDRGVTFLWWTIDSPLNARVLKPELFYKFVFATMAIPFWLAWGATILGLVSTAGMIPEFVQGGSIELAVSKPIGRARLILTKYLAGLTFAGLQVAVFSAASFLVIGIRGHSWEPAIFLAIPILLLFFSYLYSVCALLGLLTRSTVAALLLTILFWVLIGGVNMTEQSLLMFREGSILRGQQIEARIESLKAQEAKQRELVDQTKQPEGEASGETPTDLRAAGAMLAMQKTSADLKRREEQLVNNRSTVKSLDRWHGIFFGVKTVLPKTSETIKLLDRSLLSREDMERFRNAGDDEPMPTVGEEDDIRVSQKTMAKRLETRLRSRTLGWIVGTSLAFEGVMLLLMLWVFRRREF